MVGSMFASLYLRYCYHVIRWRCYCFNWSFHFKTVWINFLPMMRIVVSKRDKLMRKHSKLFSIQTAGKFNTISSSSALKSSIYKLYICSSSFASRNCAECDSHIAAMGYKSVCPFFIANWMTVSFHWHANVLQDILSLIYFVLRFTFACCGFVLIYIYEFFNTIMLFRASRGGGVFVNLRDRINRPV
jgi:hypothetical protein